MLLLCLVQNQSICCNSLWLLCTLLLRFSIAIDCRAIHCYFKNKFQFLKNRLLNLPSHDLIIKHQYHLFNFQFSLYCLLCNLVMLLSNEHNRTLQQLCKDKSPQAKICFQNSNSLVRFLQQVSSLLMNHQYFTNTHQSVLKECIFIL